MLLSLGRIIKFSLQDIARNVWLSLVTVIILVLALFTVNMLLIVKVVGEAAVDAIKERIDVNLFLRSAATEDEIMALKTRIESLPEVREAVYVSKEDALAKFRSDHEDNPEILEALRELGTNPLTPNLVIRPKSLDQFDALINQINALDDEIIESRNFTNYKTMLAKINAITDKVQNAGLFLSAIFILITVLVVYNSVRVAIYTHKREIMIMRLVGASRWFIQAPYLLSGLLYTLIGIAAIMAIFYPFLTLLQPYLETFFVGYNVDLINYFYGHWPNVFGAQFLALALVNILASQLAVSKYSRV
jgi:cell division transport system permease protein